jgi:hypothetical protein
MIVSWDVNAQHFESPDEVRDFLIERTALCYNPGGTKGMAYFLGPGTPEQASPRHKEGLPPSQLRIDIDRASGLGAARWYDGDLMAVQPGYDASGGFGTWTQRFEPVPFHVAGLDFMTALRLAVEYARTGLRPTVDLPVGTMSWVACDWMG